MANEQRPDAPATHDAGGQTPPPPSPAAATLSPARTTAPPEPERDNTFRRELASPRPPTARELADLRKRRFGVGPGSVRLDADIATGGAKVVYIDGEGAEVGAEPFDPGQAAEARGATAKPAEKAGEARPATMAKVEEKAAPGRPDRR